MSVAHAHEGHSCDQRGCLLRKKADLGSEVSSGLEELLSLKKWFLRKVIWSQTLIFFFFFFLWKRKPK